MSARDSRRSLYAGYLLVGLVATLAGFSIYQASDQPPEGSLPKAQSAVSEKLLGTRRPEFNLPNAEGEATSISRWDGDVVLVNFWATWCRPCRKEMPVLAQLQGQYGDRGFQVVGVAIDLRDAVTKYTAAVGADYPQLVGREDAIAIADRYGNHYGALPYSVLIDREGIIRFVKPGELRKGEIEDELLKLL
jgi:thiol-disulfide isomerase/thioredoxin